MLCEKILSLIVHILFNAKYKLKSQKDLKCIYGSHNQDILLSFIIASVRPFYLSFEHPLGFRSEQGDRI